MQARHAEGQVGQANEREERFRGARLQPRITNRTGIVVDDGLATGAALRAILQVLRAEGSARLVAAVPVGPRNAHEVLRRDADEVVCLFAPDPFGAVSSYYDDFRAVTDEGVQEILGEFNTGGGQGPAHSALRGDHGESRAMRPSVTLALAGDVMLGRGVNRRITDRGGGYPWGNLLPVIRRADCFLINLECALTSHRKRRHDDGSKAFYFRAHPRAVETLQLARVDFAALANNHAADYEMVGLLDTIGHLDAASIAHAGTGADLAAASAPAYVRAGDRRVGIVAFADYPPSWAAGQATPGINYTPVSLAQDSFAVIERTLTVVRQQADLVIFSIHWGPNMRERPTLSYRNFARKVIEAGADVFWGHSAHVVQGIEVWQGKPILYDTGDFVDDYAADAALRNDLSALFLLRTRPPHLERIDLIPMVIRGGQVNRARGADRDWFGERFTALCAELGTAVQTANGLLRVNIGAAPKQSVATVS